MTFRVENAPPVSRPSGIMTCVAWILRQLEVVSTLDALLDWDPAQCRLSPGTRLLALMLCALFDRTGHGQPRVGAGRLPRGARLRYLTIGHGVLLGGLGFGAAAWTAAPGAISSAGAPPSARPACS